MNTKKLLSGFLLISVCYFSGCATRINSYPVTGKSVKDLKGGIRYYMPKPMLLVKEPIETERTEEIQAIISLGGITQFLYPIKMDNFDTAIAELARLKNVSSDSIELEELQIPLTYLSEEIIQKSQYDSTTKKHTAFTTPSATIAQSSPGSAYTPSDIAKSISVIFLPDYDREYELVIKPSLFSSLDVEVTLTDGWMLTSFSSDSGENQLVGALKDLATTVIGAKKEMDLAKLEHAQALRLKELESERTEDSQEIRKSEEDINITVQVKGYVKRVTIKVIQPGIYDLIKLLNDGSWDIPLVESSFLQQLQL